LKMQHEFCISPSVVAMISADDPWFERFTCH
jgi:hypothetical protein